ncbi:hypothetical protein [Rothia uropygialis]|uniref:hypothetical protein n=1 Tax=Kocuria sp. 36 TaxID=1415402 RepID=UPI001EE86343|nr:hypothetical protein [Kocuria sp. 36]
MTHNISRRTLAKGAAWSAPMLAASATVPAFAASQPPSPAPISTDPCLTPEEVQSGNCARAVHAFNNFLGVRTYTLAFGGLANANLQYSVSAAAKCWPWAQLMSFKTYDGGSNNHQVPRPSVVLPREGGRSFTGRATLGSVASWGVKDGVPLSANIQWDKSTHTDKLDWKDAQVTIPLQAAWSNVGYGSHVCFFDLKFELSGGYTGFYGTRRRMNNIRFVLHGQ